MSALLALLVPLLIFVVVAYVLFWLTDYLPAGIVQNLVRIVLAVLMIFGFITQFGHFIGIH